MITRILHAPLAELEVSSTRSTLVSVANDFGVSVGEPSCNTNVPEFQHVKIYTLIRSYDSVLCTHNNLHRFSEKLQVF